MKYLTWKKGELKQLSPHFASHELECPCPYRSCKEQRVSQELLQRLENIRGALGSPVKVTSAFRCREYQKHLEEQGYNTAKGISTHELGHAADIKAADIVRLKQLAHWQFKAVGEASTWVHVDLRDDKTRLWYY